LDDWAWAMPAVSPLSLRVIALARAADPSPWRNQVRAPLAWQDIEQMRRLAAKAKPEGQSPLILSRLAWGLWSKGAHSEAQALLHQGLVHHPKDFWLHFNLAAMADNPKEKAAYFRAALAVRPHSSVAHCALADELRLSGDLDGAVAHYR